MPTYNLYDNVKCTQRFHYNTLVESDGENEIHIPLFIEPGMTGHVTACYGDFRVWFDGILHEVAIPRALVEPWPEGPNRQP